MDDYFYSDVSTLDSHPFNCACCMTWEPSVASDSLAVGAPPTPDLMGTPHEAIAWSDPFAIGAPPTPDLLGAPVSNGTIDLSGIGTFENQSVIPLGQPLTGTVDLPHSVIPPVQPQEGIIDLSGIGTFESQSVVPLGQPLTGSVDLPQSVVPLGQPLTGSVDLPQSVVPLGQPLTGSVDLPQSVVPLGQPQQGAIDFGDIGVFDDPGVPFGQSPSGSVELPQSVPFGQSPSGSVELPQSVPFGQSPSDSVELPQSVPFGQSPTAMINFSGIGTLEAPVSRPGVAQIDIGQMDLRFVQESLANRSSSTIAIGGSDGASTNATLTLLNLHGAQASRTSTAIAAFQADTD